MTRLAGYAGRGGNPHPLLAERPDYSSDNYVTNSFDLAGKIAILGAAAAFPFRRRFWSPAVNASAVLATIIVPYQIMYPRLVQRSLEAHGEKVEMKKKPLISNIGKIEYDDFALGGILIGLAAAANPTILPHIPLRAGRFLGFSVIGCAAFLSVGQTVWPPLRKAQREVIGKTGFSWQWSSTEPFSFNVASGTGATSGPKVLSIAEYEKQHPGKSPIETVPSVSGSEPRSISKPHYAVDSGSAGEPFFVAKTDYTWLPSGPAEGIEVLREHIKELSDRRAVFKQVADYLWVAISEKEIEFYNTTPLSEEQQQQRATLEFLNVLHVEAYTEMANLSWMIADSSKNIRQLDFASSNVEGGTLMERKHQEQVHESIVKSIWKDTPARISGVESALNHLQYLSGIAQKSYDENIDILFQQALNSGAVPKGPNGKVAAPVEKETRRFLREALDRQAQGNVVRLIREQVRTAQDELTRLRETSRD